MENAYFLISEVKVEDGSHQLLHSLTCAQVNAEVFVFVSDFENLQPLREEFPSVIFILLDLTKNVNINKDCLSKLPGMDCFLNYSGESFAMITKQLEAVKISRKCQMKYKTITLEGIAKELSQNRDAGTVLITISPKKGTTPGGSGGKYQGPPWSAVKFRPGLKFAKSSDPYVEQPTETEPLIPSTSSNHQQEPEPWFLSWLFCFGYCFSSDSGPTEFESPEQLRSYIRSEQTEEIRKGLKNLFKTAEWELASIINQLNRKEQRQIEELVLNIEDKKSQDETELNRKKDLQNAATQNNLSGTQSEYLTQKIKDSKERNAKTKVQYDADQSLREGSVRIKEAAEIERASSKDNNYSKVLQEQFEILAGVYDKYTRKYQMLLEKHFSVVENV